ncbi:serine hydrolase domain-containing protein [Pseudoalteromonas sp. MTN2-4]|uniref:serine hydrolase domain-containing protein n=1 Tax=Pseudoalteromonas sp. MTN2-4 TaxID=3056555 RepID=UPI0036F3B491
MKTKPYIFNLTCVAVALLLTACGSSNKAAESNVQSTQPLEQQFDYQALLDKTVEGEIPGVVLYIDSPTLKFHGAAGIADINEQTPMQVDARIPNGSAGKKLTALLASMLVNDQLLDLDKPITTYLPTDITSRVANSEAITTRQMLQHTAGIIDYLNESDGAFYDAVLKDPDSLKTDAFAMSFVYGQEANFKAGSDWAYSNTGYILTGLIFDELLEEHHSRAMRQQIFEPFGLNSMSYGGVEKEYANINSGYFLYDGELIDTKPYYKNIGVADAPVVGTAKDMADLLSIIVSGEYLNSASYDLLLAESSFINTNIDGLQYSYGLFKEMINGKEVIHHHGSELGYATYNFHIKETDTTAAFIVNCNGYTRCDNAHNKLYEEILVELIN